MQLISTSLPDVILIAPQVFADERGYFFESFNQRELARHLGIALHFVQDNQSGSRRNVVRGLHYQTGTPQGKLVRVCSGAILDVAVDLRRSSPTFGRWCSTLLSAENRLQVWIPPGFAHGFKTLSESAEVLYKTTTYWDPANEHCVRWDDPELAIDWQLDTAPILSTKDSQGLLLRDSPCFA